MTAIRKLACRVEDRIGMVRGLPRNVSLRAGDAIHLATALEVGEAEVWTNDRHLLAAASHFGLAGKSAGA